VTADWQFNLISKTTFDSYVATYLTMLVNTVLIPSLIDLMVRFEDFETKSERQLSILMRNYVFMMLNSVLLPLTSQKTIEDFISILGRSRLYLIPELLA
jgi:high-affinity K+ transport system ATPase subunit B